MKRSVILVVFTSLIVLCYGKPHESTVSSNEDQDEGYAEVEEENDINIDDESGDILERGAVYGHSTIAANPATDMATGNKNPFKIEYADHTFNTGFQGSAQGHDKPHYSMDIFHNSASAYKPPYDQMFPYPHQRQEGFHLPTVPHQHSSGKYNQHSTGKYAQQNGDDLREALEHLDYVKWLVAGHASYMKANGCSGSAESKGIYQSFTDQAKSCQPQMWKKCNCMSPATYSDEGRGNCNLGATKSDLKVWCYVDDNNGDPATVCPDSKPSKSKPGYYWSRMACIT